VHLAAHGARWHLPLGTDDSTAAARLAARLDSIVQREGWEETLATQRREATLAVLWNANPLTTTYTTIFSAPGAAPFLRPATAGAVRVIVIEPDSTILAAMTDWLEPAAGFSCVGAFPTAATALAQPLAAEVVLFNARLADLPADELAAKFRAKSPDICCFPHSIYPDSDELFTSVTGASGGYFLQRKLPLELLQPIAGAAGDCTPRRLNKHISQYWTSLLSQPLAGPESNDQFTEREHQILRCLCDGSPDKLIADSLGLSVWTVHTHMKHIFKKLKAHSRTEAVMRYLQK
jgi:DNA-binding NarL/FixJ family response regulator